MKKILVLFFICISGILICFCVFGCDVVEATPQFDSEWYGTYTHWYIPNNVEKIKIDETGFYLDGIKHEVVVGDNVIDCGTIQLERSSDGRALYYQKMTLKWANPISSRDRCVDAYCFERTASGSMKNYLRLNANGTFNYYENGSIPSVYDGSYIIKNGVMLLKSNTLNGNPDSTFKVSFYIDESYTVIYSFIKDIEDYTAALTGSNADTSASSDGDSNIGEGTDDPSDDPIIVHVHTYSDEWSKDGEYHWHAATCGHEEVMGKAFHSWDEGTITLSPTEESEGVKMYTCTVCGETMQEPLPRHIHTFSSDWVTDEEYHWHEANCGHNIIRDKELHDWYTWSTTAPSETQEGEHIYYCRYCSLKKSEILPRIEHTHSFGAWEVVVSSNCIRQGEERRYCSGCAVYETRIISIDNTVHENTVIDGAILSTCSETGLTEGSHCEDCGIVLIPQTVTSFNENNHTFGGWIIEDDADCLEEGIEYRRCEMCGKAENRSIPAKGHTISDCSTIREETCALAGLRNGTCAICGQEAWEKIAKTEHTWSNWSVVKQASCGLGTEERTCASCGKVEHRNIDPVFTMVHSFDESDVCTVCGEHKKTAGLQFTITNGEASVKGYIGSDTEVYIPTYYAGCPVTSIGNYAFHGNEIITSVYLANTVTHIGYYAFYSCKKLKQITFPESMTTIGSYAFQNAALQSISIPESVTTIGYGAFEYCELQSVAIPEGLTQLNFGLIYGLLECIEIPNTITCIQSNIWAKSVLYNGTRAEWDMITKVEDWNRKSNYELHCLDD